MKALMLRAQYMVWSLQTFPRVAARCLRMLVDENFLPSLIDDEIINEILGSRAATKTQGPAPGVLITLIFIFGLYLPFSRLYLVFRPHRLHAVHKCDLLL